ncbi:hypothetical protein BDV96DRAFT_690580 [Lophiotrema nucula]|uniref:Uncharacterized protein n=1 Tax=Lophiotrema nucula TaxID=690887 RepID=A0A6A5YWL2_9PLEO|nr:hypothetical protein BDV96DRAFT_690580 [Lophiotrema nucula]
MHSSNTSFSSVPLNYPPRKRSLSGLENSSIWEQYSIIDLVDLGPPLPPKPPALRTNLQPDDMRCQQSTSPVTHSAPALSIREQVSAIPSPDFNHIFTLRSDISHHELSPTPPYDERSNNTQYLDKAIDAEYTLSDSVYKPPSPPLSAAIHVALAEIWHTQANPTKPQPPPTQDLCIEPSVKRTSIAAEQNVELFLDIPTHPIIHQPSSSMPLPDPVPPLIVLTPPEESENDCEWLPSMRSHSPRLEEYRTAQVMRARKIDIARTPKGRVALHRTWSR